MAEAIGFLTADDHLRKALQEVLGRVPALPRRQFVLEGAAGRRKARHEVSRLLILSWAKDLATAHPRAGAEGISRCWEGYLVFVGRNTPAEALSSVARLRVQDPSRLQFVTAAGPEEAREHLEAFVQRLIHARGSEGVLHAWWAGDSLEVLTTEFRRISVPRQSIAPLADASVEECQDLEVGYDGSYIVWPAADVHLGFEQIESLTSPEKALRWRQENDEFNTRYGAAIRAVRRAAGLAQSSIPGLSARHVGRIERGETRATSKALRILARAHGLSEAEYLEQIATALAQQG